MTFEGVLLVVHLHSTLLPRLSIVLHCSRLQPSLRSHRRTPLGTLSRAHTPRFQCSTTRAVTLFLQKPIPTLNQPSHRLNLLLPLPFFLDMCWYLDWRGARQVKTAHTCLLKSNGWGVPATCQLSRVHADGDTSSLLNSCNALCANLAHCTWHYCSQSKASSIIAKDQCS